MAAENLFPRFLGFLAEGKYHDAESWLLTMRLNARKNRDWAGFYAATYLLGVCYQQEGQLAPSTRSLNDVIRGSKDPALVLRSKVHLTKVLSQEGRYRRVIDLTESTLSSVKEGRRRCSNLV